MNGKNCQVLRIEIDDTTIICEYVELLPAKTSGYLADIQGIRSPGTEHKVQASTKADKKLVLIIEEKIFSN